MARRTAAEAELTRRKILMAANEVFWDEGVDNAALATVAKMAGVTRGAVYWHFKDKHAILNALFDELSIPLRQPVPRNACLDNAWTWLARVLLNTVGDDTARKLLSIMFFQGPTGECGIIRDGLTRLRKQFMRQIAAILESASRNGEISPDINLEMVEALFQSAISGLLYECLQQPENKESLIRSVLESLLCLIKSPPEHLLKVSVASGNCPNT